MITAGRVFELEPVKNEGWNDAWDTQRGYGNPQWARRICKIEKGTGKCCVSLHVLLQCQSKVEDRIICTAFVADIAAWAFSWAGIIPSIMYCGGVG